MGILPLPRPGQNVSAALPTKPPAPPTRKMSGSWSRLSNVTDERTAKSRASGLGGAERSRVGTDRLAD